MKKLPIITLLTAFIFLMSCKKDSENESLTVTFSIGDQFSYVNEIKEHFDDTTSSNIDSINTRRDTTSLIVEKDTIINNLNCLKLKYYGPLNVYNEAYFHQNEQGIQLVAYKYKNLESNLQILSIPELVYPNNMKIGMHWGESPDGKNSRYEVLYFEDIFVNNNKTNCLKLRYNTYEEDEFIPSNFQKFIYIDSKGIAKEEYSYYFYRNNEEFKGLYSVQYVGYRL